MNRWGVDHRSTRLRDVSASEGCHVLRDRTLPPSLPKYHRFQPSTAGCASYGFTNLPRDTVLRPLVTACLACKLPKFCQIHSAASTTTAATTRGHTEVSLAKPLREKCVEDSASSVHAWNAFTRGSLGCGGRDHSCQETRESSVCIVQAKRQKFCHAAVHCRDIQVKPGKLRHRATAQ